MNKKIIIFVLIFSILSSSLVSAGFWDWFNQVTGKATYSCQIKGDVNYNGKLDSDDVSLVMDMYFGRIEVDLCGDMNGDGTITMSDANLIQQKIDEGSQDEEKCSDGTLKSQCSTTKPEYCTLTSDGSYVLINKCSECGCPSGQVCQNDGSCKTVECETDLDCGKKLNCVNAYCLNGKCYCGDDTKKCFEQGDCSNTEFCEFDKCTAETGTCIEIPEICPTLYEPVCGCDGKTYSNDCSRKIAKVSKAYDGECKTTTCTDTDGGKNYYVKGSVSICYLTSEGSETCTSPVYDTCTQCTGLCLTNDPECEVFCGAVKEYYCGKNEADTTLTQIQSETYVCPNGCKDGACIKSIKREEPFCSAIGTRSEGWYQYNKLIKYDNCNGCHAVCKFVGTNSEGWYSSCTNKLIKWEKCGEVTCLGEGEGYAVVPNAPECCSGLTSIDCEKPDNMGNCQDCVGAFFCTYCGNNVCGAGENICNCPEDCVNESILIGDVNKDGILDEDDVILMSKALLDIEKLEVSLEISDYNKDSKFDILDAGDLDKDINKRKMMVLVEEQLEPGDVNGDGEITPLDALLVFEHYLRQRELTPEQIEAGEVNGDEELTPADALLIFEYYLTIIDEFPVEKEMANIVQIVSLNGEGHTEACSGTVCNMSVQEMENYLFRIQSILDLRSADLIVTPEYSFYNREQPIELNCEQEFSHCDVISDNPVSDMIREIQSLASNKEINIMLATVALKEKIEEYEVFVNTMLIIDKNGEIVWTRMKGEYYPYVPQHILDMIIEKRDNSFKPVLLYTKRGISFSSLQILCAEAGSSQLAELSSEYEVDLLVRSSHFLSTHCHQAGSCYEVMEKIQQGEDIIEDDVFTLLGIDNEFSDGLKDNNSYIVYSEQYEEDTSIFNINLQPLEDIRINEYHIYSEVRIDSNITEEEFLVGDVKCDTGCLDENNNCLPISTRTSTQYCDVDKKLKNQLSGDILCNNNYECQSNLCIDGKCTSLGLFQRFTRWFQRLFG